MNPGPHPSAATTHPQAAGHNLDDVCFTLFHHKRLILSFVALGLVGVIAVRMVRPPLYVSKAKLMVRYVLQNTGVNPSNPETQVQTTEAGGQNIIYAQAEILTSLDVALQAADLVGPAKILAKKGGGSDRMAAAGVVCSGITVDPPKTAIITVSFKHPDQEVVQPILEAVLKTYMRKHLEVYQGIGVLDEYYRQQRDELSLKLRQTDEELKRLMADAKVLFPDDNEQSYRTRLAKVQEELFDAQIRLAKSKAVIGNVQTGTFGEGTTNAAETSLPPEKISDYSFAAAEIENLKKRERELLLQFTEAYPIVQAVRSQIKKLSDQKAALERDFPALTTLAVSGARSGTNAAGLDVAGELAEVKRLNATVLVLGNFLSNTLAETSRVMDIKPRLTELKRKHEELEKNYRFCLNSLEQAGQAMAAGKVVSMSMVQNPTPPGLDYKKLLKMVGLVFGGCVGMGLGLAFLLDLVLDRTIRRSADVERHLRLPVFLTIPDTAWSRRARLPGWLRRGRHATGAAASLSGNGHGEGTLAVAPWSPEHHLQTYAEGLRERLMTHFEIHNLNLKKPKLVGLTGCGKGSGVTTLASGLAAALSKTGDGNVLLVDMNADEGMARSFHKGKPGCGVSDALQPDSRGEAQVQENLFVATLGDTNNDKLAKALPNRFNHLMPQLKASDYDYIIFDMPPVSQTSATPRLAGHMDITLLVLESEKTGQQLAARASSLMRESRANVAAVLNKYRQHVPAQLSQEL